MTAALPNMSRVMPISMKLGRHLFRSIAVRRNLFILVHDSMMAFAAILVAFWLRYGIVEIGQVDAIAPDQRAIANYSALFGVIALFVFGALRVYRDFWRFTSMRSLGRILQAVGLTVLIFSMVAFLLMRNEHVPRTVPILAGIFLSVLVMLPRIFRRLQLEGNLLARPVKGKVPVLLVGVGTRADSFIRAMRRNEEAPYRVEGLLSEDQELRARRLHGISVLGMPGELRSVVGQLKARGLRIQKVILTGDETFGGIGASVVEDCQRLGLSIARLPHFAELRDGTNSDAEVHPIAIEDLLGRPQVHLDQAQLRRLIHGRRVMVTGAGGSIGAELSRQVAAQGPARIVLLDNSEFNLYSIDRSLADIAASVPRRAGLCDVRDRQRVDAWFHDEAPEVVFHAAALKHVPLVEDHSSEGVLTNVIGTRNVADAAKEMCCSVMVLISSDKAVNPVNIMGATKRVAEAYCQALDVAASNNGGGTRYVTVRFGNVLGSTGSVVPLFQKQLARGGPLTVTHPEIQRYFMTIPEAVQLVLQASASAVIDPSVIGQIFVLDMGSPIRISDLARQMIRLSGKRPDIDVQIDIVGLRPGEKLSEELAYPHEGLAPTQLPGVLLARPALCDLGSLKLQIGELEAAARAYHDIGCIELLRGTVPEFSYSPRNGSSSGFPMAAE